MDFSGNTTTATFISGVGVNVDKTLSMIKKIQMVLGFLFVLGTLTISLAIGLHLRIAVEKPIDQELNVTQNITKSAFCLSMKTYVLTPSYRAMVCNHRFEGVRLDIRQFIGAKPTIKGIVLAREPFRALESIWSDIVTHMNGV